MQQSDVTTPAPSAASMRHTQNFNAACVCYCRYNRINGTYACENPETIGWLKNTAGFQGWLMSDWGATHSTIASANVRWRFQCHR